MGVTHTKCLSSVRLDGKTAIVTGSNTGIGKITAQEFYKRGARVIMACRNNEKANQAVEEIKKTCEQESKLGEIMTTDLDLGNLKSIRNCAKKILDSEEQINILVNNAGVMMCPESKTADGFETQLGTNHLGHFLFTLLLLPKIIRSPPARIINVSSTGHTRGRMNFEDLNFETRRYSAFQAYAQSKLANILFTKELSRLLKEHNIENVTTYCVHPGLIATELGRHLDTTYFTGLSKIMRLSLRMFVKTPEEGAQTTLYCAISDEASNETGLYYSECKVTEPSNAAYNMEDAKHLWNISKKLVGLNENYNPFV